MRAGIRTILSLAMMSLLSVFFDPSGHSTQIIAASLPASGAHTHTSHKEHTEGYPQHLSDDSIPMAGGAPNTFPPPGWPSPVDDQRHHGFFLADILEYRPDLGGTNHGNDYRWDIEGWYGGDYNRVWFKSEGQQNTAFKADYDFDSQLLYGRFFQQYYDFQVGGRLETQSFRGRNVTRGLAVVGLQGLVPYNYEIQPAFFISQDGDVSARLTATKDLLLTQRLILQIRVETNAAVQRVKKFTTGSGLNNLEGGVRLRYEIRREFAPYIGVSLDKSIGDTASLVREEGGNSSQVRLVVGVRAWF